MSSLIGPITQDFDLETVTGKTLLFGAKNNQMIMKFCTRHTHIMHTDCCASPKKITPPLSKIT